jgi:hypothetical protein
MMVKVRIRDEEYVLSRTDIEAVAQRETPRRLNAYFVEVDGRRYPPKQLIRGATRTTHAFDSALAVRALRALGFEVVTIAGGSAAEPS